MYAHVIACTGWTWDYVAEHLDLPRLKALNLYWADNPPLHRMVASFLGIEPTPSAPQQSASLEEAAEFIPANRVSESEFDAILAQHGLPISKPKD